MNNAYEKALNAMRKDLREMARQYRLAEVGKINMGVSHKDAELIAKAYAHVLIAIEKL